MKLGNRQFCCGTSLTFGSEKFQVFLTFMGFLLPLPVCTLIEYFIIQSVISSGFSENGISLYYLLGSNITTIILFWVNVLREPGIVLPAIDAQPVTSLGIFFDIVF